MATNDVYEVTVKATWLGQQIVNSVYMMANAAFVPSGAQALTLANDFKEAMRPNQRNDLTYTNYSVRQVAGPNVTYSSTKPYRSGGIVFEGSLTGTLTGGNASGSEALTPANNMVVKLFTGLIGRRRRGRFYITGHTVSSVDDGKWGATPVANFQTTVTTFFDKYKNGGTDANWDWVVFSFREASGLALSNTWPRHLVPVAAPDWQDASAFVTAATVQDRIGIQRRRSIGVGS